MEALTKIKHVMKDAGTDRKTKAQINCSKTLLPLIIPRRIIKVKPV